MKVVENILETFVCYAISMMYEKSEQENLQILRRMFAVIEQRKKIWLFVGLTMRIGKHDFFDAFIIHGSAICFWTSDCVSSFLCSVPSYMPSFGEKD